MMLYISHFSLIVLQTANYSKAFPYNYNLRLLFPTFSVYPTWLPYFRKSEYGINNFFIRGNLSEDSQGLENLISANSELHAFANLCNFPDFPTHYLISSNLSVRIRFVYDVEGRRTQTYTTWWRQDALLFTHMPHKVWWRSASSSSTFTFIIIYPSSSPLKMRCWRMNPSIDENGFHCEEQKNKTLEKSEWIKYENWDKTESGWLPSRTIMGLGLKYTEGDGGGIQGARVGLCVWVCLTQNEDKWKNTTKRYTIFILLKKEWREYYFPVSR